MPNTPTIPIKFEFDDKDFNKLATQMDQLYKDAQKFSNAIKQGTNVKSNTDGLKQTTKHMGEIVNLQNKHAIAAQKTGGIIGGLKNKIKQLGTAIDSATNPNDVKRYNAELIKTRKEIVKAKDATRGWGKALGSFQFKFNALGNIASNVASSITNGITRALKETVKTVIDFEKSFANVLTLLDKASKAKYGELLKGTSVAIMRKYGLAVEDTNKAMFDAISAGVKATDVFNVLDASAKLAVGGVTDLNSAVKGVASVMNAFNLSSSESLDIASAFFQAQKFGITYIDDMVKSMGRANTIAKLSGASYREMLAAFTAITKSGLNTEEAITGLRNIFKELVASSGEAAAELNRLGIATGSNAVQQRGFIGVLDDLNEAYLENNEIIPKIFGNIRGLTGIMGVVGERYADFRFILEQVNDAMASNEALNDAVSTQMDTISKKLDILKSAWDTLWVAMEDGSGQAGSSMKTLIDYLTQVIKLISPDYFEQYTLAMADAGKTVTKIVDGYTKAAKEQAKTEEESIKLVKAALEEEIELREGKYKKSQQVYLDELVLLEQRRAELALISAENDYYNKKEEAWLTNQVKLLERSVDAKDIVFKKDKSIYEGVLNGLAEISEARAISEEEAEKLSEEEYKAWLKAQKAKLKAAYDYRVSTTALQEDSLEKSISLADLEYDYKKSLIELTIKDEEVKSFELETIYANLINKRQKALKEEVERQLAAAEKVKEAWAETFEFDDEEFIDDIPFDTEKVVAELKKKKGSLGDLLGISDVDQDTLNVMIDAVTEFTDLMVELADRRIDAIQREIDASDQRMRSLESDRDHEWERMKEGYANNYALKQQEIDDEKARKKVLEQEEKKALKQRKIAADAQVVINTLMQTSNLILAVSALYAQETAKAGLIGVAVATAGAAILIGAFLGFKASAQEASGFAEGVIDLQGEGTAKSDSIPARLSVGESVITAGTTRPNKRTLRAMEDNPNHPLFATLEKDGVGAVFNRLSDQMGDSWNILNSPNNKWDERMYYELKSGNEEMKNRPYSYMKGGKLYTIEGNQITETTIKNG